MPEIQIFVSCRTDIQSKIPKSPLYMPIRCGAAYDIANKSGLPGDDTGENISCKKPDYSEFTVQYWAWKNVKADYYGLCHYRRFLAFTERRYHKNDLGLVEEPLLCRWSERKYSLLDAQKMAQTIEQYDLIVMEGAEVERMCPLGGQVKTIREMWDAHDGVFFRKSALDMLLVLIDEKRPDYSSAARDYMESGIHYGYNCYIMRRELFEELCEFQFPLLFELEQRLEADPTGNHLLRTLGFLGEILYGIFVYRRMNTGSCRVKELPLVYFVHTEQTKNPIRKCLLWADGWITVYGRRVVDWIAPKGTKRREVLKNLYYKLSGKERPFPQKEKEK